MREDFWEYGPTDKIWLAANSKPRIRGQDRAVWRRITLIPFAVTIPEKDQDKHLTEKLCNELPGILNWAIEGCLAWQQNGLAVPPDVKDATKEYREEEDVVGAFIQELCVVADGLRTPGGTLYKVYRRWCKDNGENALTQNAFGRRLTAKGFERDKHIRLGIGLLSDPTSTDQFAEIGSPDWGDAA